MEIMSDNHPTADICDDLSCKRGETGKRGTYPKTFVFKGWHPQCRCYCVPILMDDDEFDRTQAAIARGEEVGESPNMVTQPNDEFCDWWSANKERIASARSLPYWVKDNGKFAGLSISDNYTGTGAKRLLSGLAERISESRISKQFQNLKTSQEVADKLSQSLSSQFDKDVEVIIVDDGITLDLAKDYAVELTKLSKQYELKQGKISKIVMGYTPEDSEEFGCTIYTPNTMTKQMFLRGEYCKRSDKYAIENSRCDKNKESISVVTHEFGHAIFQFTNDADNNYFKLSVEGLYQEYLREIRGLVADGDMTKLAKLILGDVADNGGVGEFLAEAFQEYKNSRNPSKYAKSIGKLIEDFFGF